jgi:hypothetical protein
MCMYMCTCVCARYQMYGRVIPICICTRVCACMCMRVPIPMCTYMNVYVRLRTFTMPPYQRITVPCVPAQCSQAGDVYQSNDTYQVHRRTGAQAHRRTGVLGTTRVPAQCSQTDDVYQVRCAIHVLAQSNDTNQVRCAIHVLAQYNDTYQVRRCTGYYACAGTV